MINEKITLTNSAIKCFKACAKKFQWRYIEQIVPRVTPEALALGSAVHKFLEYFYQKQAYLPTRMDRASPRSMGILEGVIETYPRLYQDDFIQFEIISIERMLSGRISHPEAKYACSTFQFGGKIDLLVRARREIDQIPKGSLILLETKTAATVDEAYWQVLEMDLQTTLYATYLEQELKEPIKYILFNIIQKPGIRQKKSETAEEFTNRVKDMMADGGLYHRKVVEITDQKRKETMVDLWHSKEQIADTMAKNVYTKTATSCYAYHRPCDYFALCTAENPEVIIDQDNRYVRKVANVELQEEEAAEVQEQHSQVVPF